MQILYSRDSNASAGVAKPAKGGRLLMIIMVLTITYTMYSIYINFGLNTDALLHQEGQCICWTYLQVSVHEIKHQTDVAPLAKHI